MEKEGLKYDQGKTRYDLIPIETIDGIAQVLTMGAEKYGSNNWQNLDDGTNRCIAAFFRHFQAWRRGEILDPESGLHHLAHALTNLSFLLWFDLNKSSFDDLYFN